MKRKEIFFLLFFLIFLISGGCGGTSGSGSSSTSPGSITLAWDAPKTNADGSSLNDLAGYRLYYGTAPGADDHSVDVGNMTTYTLTGLTKGNTYYIIVRAYDTSNNESANSNQVSGTAK
jgi:hypothetical protein